MKKRTTALVTVLAISFFMMILFLFIQYGATKEQLILAILFGVILVTTAIFILKTEKKVFKGKSIIKIIFASFALAFALTLLVGILALPFVGFKALELLIGNNTGIILIVLAVVVSPITAKYLR